MIRPGITSPVLVRSHQIVMVTLWLMTPRCHWEMFPNNRKVPDDILQELSGILLHSGIGRPGPVLDVV